MCYIVFCLMAMTTISPEYLAADDSVAGNRIGHMLAMQSSLSLSQSSNPATRAAAISAIITDLTQIEQSLRKTPRFEPFVNSVRMTNAVLLKQKNAFEGYGMAIPAEFLVQVGISPVENTWLVLDSDQYWLKMRDAMRLFGCLESANLKGLSPGGLYPKAFYNESLPKDAHLILHGEYRGFLVMPGGDLVIPGVAFYRSIVNDDKMETLPTTNDFYISQYKSATALSATEPSKAMSAMKEILASRFASEEVKAYVHWDLSALYLKAGDHQGWLSSLVYAAKGNVRIPKLYELLEKIYEENGYHDQAAAYHSQGQRIQHEMQQKLPMLVLEGVKGRKRRQE
jgi:hypothetical protein